MYNSASLNANEFISDEEVMESLAYADANKDNYPLIRQILDKAALRPWACGMERDGVIESFRRAYESHQGGDISFDWLEQAARTLLTAPVEKAQQS